MRMTPSEAAVLDLIVVQEQRKSPFAEVNRATILRGLVEKEAKDRGIDASGAAEPVSGKSGGGSDGR